MIPVVGMGGLSQAWYPAKDGEPVDGIIVSVDYVTSHDRLLRWVKEWVLTGEMRLDDDCDEGDEIWEEYAGWLPVHEMPAEVQALRGQS